MGLPGREELVQRLDGMIAAWNTAADGRPAMSLQVASLHTPEPSPPAIYVVGIEGHDELLELDPEGTDLAVRESARRLDGLVRANDVLGLIEPCLFVLAASSVAPSSAGVIMERIAGAIAMPVDIDGQPVSLSVGIGVAFAFDGTSAERMLDEAVADLDRFRAR